MQSKDVFYFLYVVAIFFSIVLHECDVFAIGFFHFVTLRTRLIWTYSEVRAQTAC